MQAGLIPNDFDLLYHLCDVFLSVVKISRTHILMTHTGRGKQKASFFVAQLDLYMCASSQHFSIDKVGPKVQQNTLEINRSAKIGAVSILRNYFGHTKVQVSMLECYLMPYFDNLIPIQSSLTLL